MPCSQVCTLGQAAIGDPSKWCEHRKDGCVVGRDRRQDGGHTARVALGPPHPKGNEPGFQSRAAAPSLPYGAGSGENAGLQIQCLKHNSELLADCQ